MKINDKFELASNGNPFDSKIKMKINDKFELTSKINPFDYLY